ncbi:hypothetical protein CDA56_10315 [Klebsiella michiganensis]|uniref:EpsG family protein n=2 Tax=Klebsiella michiganensis TaxID=1134687 RepID=UPI000CE19519|nr:EpsG family protein [Klebsiella michiganensis]KAB7490304.1 EpsG family protein [Klebsiella michiganensis]MDQ2566189.1 EpsG family protein [Klebsiella michiganensis]PPA49006.1 hypothetical protein CDA56_10315 [Klebsiella michiganensis]HBM3174942.1 EpsG family protein [Klebsiella michiganensis]
MVSEQHFSILQGQQQQITLMLILIFFIIMFIVSPVLSFFGLIVFFSLIRIDERLIRFLFAMLALISGVAIYASRFVHPVELGGDDFSNQYYPLFKSLSSGASIFSSQFGGGVEFGLAAIYKVIGFFNPTATYWEIFFIVSFLCVFLYYIWFERFIVSRLSGRDITLCLASALLFFGFFITTQLIRQALSSVFILYSLSYLSEGNRKKAYICCIIGCIFHITALPFVFLFYQLMHGKKKIKIIIVGCFIAFGVLFSVFLGVMSSGAVSSIIASKFLYYNQNTDSGIASAYYWRILLILCVVYFFFSKRNDENDSYKSLLYYGTIIYICLINIPFASDRTLMVLVIFYLGIVVYHAFYKIKHVYVLIIIALSIYRIITLGPYYDTNCHEAALCLWSSYPWYGSLL